ncbi:kinesin-like protein KIF20B [Lagopus muta]|uniref:kinesin-like protein KIF20B n=1 Tax=Lagopus muta TaxID=64668 RepID=UPI0020A169AF|nr:kinesin-like protein KIF20B [Lagopus muta]
METNSEEDNILRPSYVAGIELPERTGLVNVEDIKTNLSDEFSSVSSSSDMSRRSSLEPRGHIQVCLRIKPFTALERANGSQGCVSLEDSTSVILKPPKSSWSRPTDKTAGQAIQKFSFSRVFGPETTQEEFFEGTVKQPVLDFLEGCNRLVFTYGVRNAGKTYTFQGTEDDVGILPRTMDMLFKTIGGRLYTKMDLKPIRWRDYLKLTKDQVREEAALKNSLLRLTKEVDHRNSPNGKAPADSKGVGNLSKGSEQSSRLSLDNFSKFSVWVSFLEIYNECFYDLLAPMSDDKKKKTLGLALDIKGYSYVKGLQWVQVSDCEEAFRLFKLGQKHRSFGSPKLNACSSRSHSIFTIKLLKIEDLEMPRVTRVNEFSLCDLAGSERYTKTRNEGDRLKESGNINTSLLTLSKCISALRISQQSKVQQHIPFRESKLTHFLQGFFSGKGKIHMLVNISQCASAYDETFNVLRFSALAQKVIVTDASVPPRDESFGPNSASRSSTPCCSKMTVPRRSTGFLWDRTQKDGVEDDDYEMEQEHKKSGEETVLKYEENKVLVGKEEYSALLSLVEDSKNQLIAEKKDKLLLELKIRDEVAQEFTRYFAQQETEFKECLSQERERLEENSEKRLDIFKELVSGYADNPGEEKLKNLPRSEQAEPLGGEHSAVRDTCADLEGILDSLQRDVMDIKKQAVAAHSYIASLEHAQEAIGRLEEQLEKTGFELMKTKEELTEKNTKLLKTEEELRQKNKDFEMKVIQLDESVEQLKEATERMNVQNERIQELTDIVVQKDAIITKLQDLRSHLEEKVKDYEKTITTFKTKLANENSNKASESSRFKGREESELEVGRKRCFEDKPPVEEPPPKKVVVKERKKKSSLEQKRMEYMKQKCSAYHMEVLALRERSETSERHLAVLEEHCRREENKKEDLSKQVTSLRTKLSFSEETAADLCEQLRQCQAEYREIASELDEQRSVNMGLEEKNVQLNNIIEAAKQNIIDKVSQVKAVQTKLGDLYRRHLESYAIDTDLVNVEDSSGSEEDEPERSQISSACLQSQASSMSDLAQDRSFYHGLERIWEACKHIIDVSSQKSQRIEALLQDVESLRKGLKDAENCNNRLEMKLSEVTNPGSQKEDPMNQLQEQIEKKTWDFEKKAAEDHRVIAQFEEEVANCEVKIRELECLLEAFRAKEGSVTKLEELLKEKESVIVNLETVMAALQEKSANEDISVEELNNEKANLMEEVVQLKNSLERMKHSLWEKEKSEKEKMQTIESLKKAVAESSVLVRNLKKDLQRKEEEYADLKDKLPDAKKQILLVQSEVSLLHSMEKSLRNRIDELEKIKQQFSEELDVKRLTIQQLRQLLNNKELEEVTRQYEKIREDLYVREKIIEAMKMTLEEQEETQLEQDQALEAQLEENERLASELETWKRRCRELQNQSNSDQQQKDREREEANVNENHTELIKLQKELKTSEAKYQTDRKKWLEEKEGLLNQVKEAENLRNREMKKFAEDRQRHGKQQAEIARLVAQLEEKDCDLQKWREERDQLVEALEVQLKTLAANAMQREREIAELKRSALKDSSKDNETVIEELRKELADKDDFIKELKQRISRNSPQALSEVPLLEERQGRMDRSVNEKAVKKESKTENGDEESIPGRREAKGNYSSTRRPSSVTSLNESEEHLETDLHSSEASTENGKTSRFPKPEVEIQLSPLQPDKMEIKQCDSMLPARVKMPRTRKKRKSDDMDEDFVISENSKNAKSAMACNSPSTSDKKMKSGKEYFLRKRVCTSGRRLTSRSDGTLQKVGDFLQSTPSIIHSKAKKLMAAVSSPKSPEPESLGKEGMKPKRSKRKLYSTDISCPLDIPASWVSVEQNKKESDHVIIKRRLRSKKR